ncbi:MAG: methyl-accepting chemotaxis protein [Chloroflexaceae bacterium]
MLRKLSPTESLSSQLIIVALLSVLIPMLLLTYINNSIAGNNQHEIAKERINAEAAATIERIELYLTERQSDVTVFAALPDVRRVVLSDARQATEEQALPILRAARDAYGYDSISVLDSSGTIVVSTDETLVAQEWIERAEVQTALQGDVAISEVRIEMGEEIPLLHFTAPVRDDQQEIAGVVKAGMTLGGIDAIVGADAGRGGEGSYGVLVDQHLIRLSVPTFPDLRLRPGAPLTAAVTQQLLAEQRFGPQTATLLEQDHVTVETLEAVNQLRNEGQEAVFFDGADNAGMHSQSVVRALPSRDWYYFYRVPTASFTSVVQSQTRTALLLTIGAVLFAILIMVLLTSRMLTRPLSQLVAASQALADGDLGQRLHFRRRDEIGRLAGSFNAMADALESRITTEQQAQAEARQSQQLEAEGRRQVEQTVADYLAFVEQVAWGDLTRRIDVRQNGALGQLGEGLNGMVAGLHTLTSQVQQASANIAAAAAEILAATTQQASSASEQSAAITQTSTTLEEVKSIAVHAAQQAAQVAQDSQAALEVARTGTQSVEETVAGMQEIGRRVEGIAQTILALVEQTQAIGTIITTVSEIADQSNLLALNAAIEAARAGEQGKSFAVVAQHVRNLAERSKGAAQQVQEILGEIQRATNTAVLVTEEGTKGVTAGSAQAGQTGLVIHRIAAEVEGGAQANVQIAAGAQQATTGLEQIGQAMESIQQATTQALASTRQAERAAQDLHTLAQSLQQTITVYRL